MSPESSVSRIKSGNALVVYAKSMGLQLGVDAAWSFVNKGLFHLVGVRSSSDWSDAHKWCQEVAGGKNYSWAGGTFAFRDPEVALMFKLSYG